MADQNVIPVPVTPQPPKPSISPVTVTLDYQLSSHFTFGMMVTTGHREWIDKNKQEALKYIDNLAHLCNDVLEPVYTLIGPCYPSSGFRCSGLNSHIGGAANSQHVYGEAADLGFLGVSPGDPLRTVFNKIGASNLVYAQLIFEFERWIHISLVDQTLYPNLFRDKRIATKDSKGKTVYVKV